jgi:vacuolar-type H+-ATPase subunit D/Vma8
MGHDAVMAANVLKSEQAIQMSVAVVRAFVRLRRMALSVEGISRKVNALEQKYDKQFRAVFDTIRQLILQPEPPRKKIGFHKK